MLHISSKVKSYPALPYETLFHAVLGKRYDLSLTFVGPTTAQALNRAHRGADYIPNVLSFPLAETAGEIYITPSIVHRECKKFNMTPDGYVGFLFIHALLHLKGYDHGDTMEKAEKRYVKRFNLS